MSKNDFKRVALYRSITIIDSAIPVNAYIVFLKTTSFRSVTTVMDYFVNTVGCRRVRV